MHQLELAKRLGDVGRGDGERERERERGREREREWDRDTDQAQYHLYHHWKDITRRLGPMREDGKKRKEAKEKGKLRQSRLMIQSIGGAFVSAG